MFILNQEQTFKIKIRNIWDKLFQKKDYILFKINNQKINLLSCNLKEDKKIILAAETIFIENLIENINNEQGTKDSFYFLLKNFIKKNNITPKDFICIIPEENYFYQILSVSGKDNIFDIIKNKINEHEIYDIEDIQLINQPSDHKDYAVWIADINYLKNINNIFKTINANILGFDPENKNIVYAIFNDFKTKDTCLIINILKNITNLIIFAGSAIHFSGFLNYGLVNLKENFNNLLEEINKLIYFYMIKSAHKHSAFPKINKILINEEIDHDFSSLISLNTKIKTEKIKININNLKFKSGTVKDFIIKNKSDFISLIGFINGFKI